MLGACELCQGCAQPGKGGSWATEGNALTISFDIMSVFIITESGCIISLPQVTVLVHLFSTF